MFAREHFEPMNPYPLSPSHALALFQALEPDYRSGLRPDAMLFHALFGTPALLGRPRPSLASAHLAAEAYLLALAASTE